MDVSNAEETASTILSSDILTAVRDTRQPYEKQLAVHLILASMLFAFAALYSLDINVGASLHFNEALNWTYQHGVYAEEIFDDK